MSRKAGLPPVARADARLLILGSLPGDASLAAAQYYAHPRNHFWPLIGRVVERDLAAMAYTERLLALQETGIALWDVVGEARRRGSLDQQIRDIQANDLRGLAGQLQKLRAVAFNGTKAGLLGAPIFSGLDLDLHHLPSSSAAYTLPFETKLASWSILALYLKV